MEDKRKTRVIGEEELDRVTGGVNGLPIEEELFCECEKPIPGFDGICRNCGRTVCVMETLTSLSLLKNQQKQL